MTPNSAFLARLAESWPPADWREVRVLVAVSGGADSVALLRGLRELAAGDASRLLVGHFHHGLRPDADDDEQFVVELARQLGLACELGRADVRSLAGEQGDGLEAAARHARHEFLHAAAHRHGARFIATAHTADDQAETILHRILRGTGLAGLAGIPRTRAIDPGLVLIRPMLPVRRAEVLEYLRQLRQAYREDCSNSDLRFTRNRLRHELLPLLASEFNPQVREALLRLGQLAGEAHAVLGESVARGLSNIRTVIDPDTVEIDVGRASSLLRYALRELFVEIWKQQCWPLQAMGYDQWERLADMISKGQPSADVLPGNIEARLTTQQVLRLSRTAAAKDRPTSTPRA
jgi:tRNA(Ile)-lysidine synthase